MKPKDFQEATIRRICEIFEKGTQNKVLLSDEVGLGKTIVARGVVEILAKKHSSVSNEPFRVVYICSNANIANQNAEKLGVPKEDCLKVSESRLSMQHLKMYQQQERTQGEKQLIPLTPATSFSLKKGCGTQKERALIFVLLDKLTDLKKIKGFSDFMRRRVKHWKEKKRQAVNSCNMAGKRYYAEMRIALDSNEDLPALKDKIKELCKSRKAPRTSRIEAINNLRMIFAKISLEKLKPDLVIMDEFQRFSELLFQKDPNKSESTMLFDEFIRKPGTKALLLSATPYKAYSTLGELQQGEDEHHKEFLDVIGFLRETPEKVESFKEVWQDYSRSLSELSKKGAAVRDEHKKRAQAAEKSLYENICRTERFNSGIIDDSGAKEVAVSPEDIISYMEIQRYLGSCGVGEVPLDYVKSSPYLISFMDRYKQKKALKTLPAKKRRVNPGYKTLLLKQSDIDKFQQIPPNNSRLRHIRDLLFEGGKSGMERLLWLPPSRPYYSVTGDVFAKKEHLSKLLVFSRWAMVPRMLASMLSYEAERLVREKLPEGKRKPYFAEEDKKRNATNSLRDGADVLFTYPCIALADLYVPHEHDGKSLKSIRKYVGGKVKKCLNDCKKRHNLNKAKSSKGGAKKLELLLRLLDGDTKEKPSVIPANAQDVLTNIAIASPAVCAYRLLRNPELAEEIGKCFVSLFNKPESVEILNIEKNKKPYYEKALEYCTEGNLQAVLDEWAYVLHKDGDDLVETMKGAFLKTVPIQVDTLESFSKKNKKPRLRSHFAVGYFDDRPEDKKVQRAEDIRAAFNSPLRPFVVATTSIGQEGLDFHLYCRKICHWNLPSNPVDLEQREGRVNRYQCLAIRQNIATQYRGSAKKNAVWESMFQAAHEQKQGLPELVPYWCLKDAEKTRVKIERIVPMYPFSKDMQVYIRLKQVLTLYRLTLGQPRQEELLEHLENLDDAAGLTLKDMQDLFLNLSPYWRTSGRRPPLSSGILPGGKRF